MTTPRTGAAGPWYITPTASHAYREIMGWPDDDEHGDRADKELIDLARACVTKTPTITQSGMLRYRGPKPLRLQLIVSPSRVAGELPALVDVLPGHAGARGWRR